MVYGGHPHIHAATHYCMLLTKFPASDVSGACCLCRYLKEKAGPPTKLATAYVMCNGEDKHIVTEWSFPITTCLVDWGQGIISSLSIEHEDTPVVQAHGTGNEGQEHVSGIGQAHVTTKVIWVIVVVFIVIWLICFKYSRRSFKATENASEPRSGRRRSVGPSSAKRKEKRLSST
ncbi:uncharacterized protein C2845_PM06G13950 [Panicum miliaceum]|uniref:Transmembrane protein n=1 Tax=Panicum miliaceum TaxID=4540 RepID=A0A3L6R7I1_PANMI|nr:uncharacterized protein C2845_PM06G13950 [Panicum miliaceum]